MQLTLSPVTIHWYYTSGPPATRSCSISSVGPPSAGPTRLDISRLEDIASELCEASLANSSRKTYTAAQNVFMDFCKSCGKSPMPASEQLLIPFVADLSLRTFYSTARTYLAAVRHLHISHGYGDPLDGRLQVLKGLK